MLRVLTARCTGRLAGILYIYPVLRLLRVCSRHILGLLLHILDGTDVKERTLRILIHLTIDDRLEALDGISERYISARDTGELLTDSLLTIDAMTWETHKISVSPSPSCRLCQSLS